VISTRTTRPVLGAAMVVGASVLFAVNGTISKLALRAGLDPVQLTSLRAVATFVGLFALCAELAVLVGYGLTGFFVVPILYFVAIARLPVGIALLLEYTAPIYVALWVRVVQRQRVRRRLWLGLALSLAGLAGVAQVWGGEGRLDGAGVLAGIAAGVLLAGFYLLGSAAVRQRDPLSLTTWAFGAAAGAGLVTQAVLRADWRALAATSGGVPVWLLCGYVIVLGSLVPFLLTAGGLRHLPATSVGIIGMTEPVLAATVAWIALAEALSPPQLIGGALVLTGVLLAETARAAGPATVAAGAPPAAPAGAGPAR
jgi:drug/metabolite transporter (DMT)-like permease